MNILSSNSKMWAFIGQVISFNSFNLYRLTQVQDIVHSQNISQPNSIDGNISKCIVTNFVKKTKQKLNCEPSTR